MTIRKRDIALPLRTPAYVSREIGAAELCISPDTWDNWVVAGKLPPSAPGMPDSTPRWRWADIDAYLSGRRQEIDLPAAAKPQKPAEPFFREVPRHGKGSPTHQRRKSASARLQDRQ